MDNLTGKKIAILSTDGFEQVELTEPKKALEQAGAKTEVISPQDGEIKGWKSTEWGNKVKVDRALKTAKADDYVFSEGQEVNLRPFRTPASINICGPWQIAATGFPASKNFFTNPNAFGSIRSLSGFMTPPGMSSASPT